MDDVAAAARAALDAHDWPTLTPLLHPYLHWRDSDGLVWRGRTKVLAMLKSADLTHGGAVVELRDGQIYRWYTESGPEAKP